MVKERQGLAEEAATIGIVEASSSPAVPPLTLRWNLARALQQVGAASLELNVKPEIAAATTRPYQGPQWKKTRQLLARSFYNELRKEGLSANQVIELSAELLGLVTADLPGRER